MIAFLEFTFLNGWHFVGVCILILCVGASLAMALDALRRA